MRILFFGSPEFAVPTLDALIAAEDVDVAAVVTQPDKPAGRGRKLTPPPVKLVAAEAGIEIRQPRSIRVRSFRQWAKAFEADAFVVVAYGRILPRSVLDIPKLGCVNLHASLLPKYRGAAPINWALVHGETTSGNTTMLMDEGMDTGDMLLRHITKIGPQETAGELTLRLSQAGGPLMLQTLRGLAEGTVTGEKQDEAAATYAPLMSREDGEVDWQQSAANVFNRWRGFTPWPGLHTSFRDKLFKLKRVVPRDEESTAAPGTLFVKEGRLLVACGDAALLEILSAQVPGKPARPAADLINGLRIESGEKLGG